MKKVKLTITTTGIGTKWTNWLHDFANKDVPGAELMLARFYKIIEEEKTPELQLVEQRANEILNKKRFRQLVYHVHQLNKQWWIDIKTGKPLKRNIGEMLMLVCSEIAEAMEAHRKDLKDQHLKHRDGFEVELADAVIRIFDIAGGLGIDLAGAFFEKLEYNRSRADHKHEERIKKGGKKY